MEAASGSIIQAGTRNDDPAPGAQSQMPDAVVELVGDHDCRAPKQRVKGIIDHHFPPQTPGIMRSLRMAAGRHGRRSPHSSPRPASTRSTPMRG